MKNLLRTVAFLCLVIMFFACTANSIDDLQVESRNNPPCLDEDPITRIVNNGTTSFDLDVLDENGIVLVTISNVPPNTTTSWASFQQGEVLFSVSNDTPLVNDNKALIQIDNCMSLEIEIDSNNEVVSYTPTNL